ncbi:ATP binding protein, partial [Reticulomyxa filosa]
SNLSEEEKQKIFKECVMLRRLDHPQILKIHSQWFNKKTDRFCFITDMMNSEENKQKKKKEETQSWLQSQNAKQNKCVATTKIKQRYFQKRQVNLKRVKTIAKQILEALSYLHSFDPPVIHRDIKCDNIFIEGTSANVVIGDLGLSTTMGGSNRLQSTMSVVGTPHWMAPEMYKEKYNQTVDIWSFGMCILELVTGRIPYEECRSAPAVYQKVTQGKKPLVLYQIQDLSLRGFIAICLEHDPRLRPSAAELLDHPFLWPRTSDTNTIKLTTRPQMETINEEKATKERPSIDTMPASSKPEVLLFPYLFFVAVVSNTITHITNKKSTTLLVPSKVTPSRKKLKVRYASILFILLCLYLYVCRNDNMHLSYVVLHIVHRDYNTANK